MWRAEVQGSRVLRAGLSGTVRWLSAELRTFSSSVPFRLLPPEFPDKLLVTALKAAQRSDKGAKPGVAPGVFQADSYCHLPVSVPLLRYQLPATAYAAPLMAQATHTVLQVGDGRGGSGWRAGLWPPDGRCAVVQCRSGHMPYLCSPCLHSAGSFRC